MGTAGFSPTPDPGAGNLKFNPGKPRVPSNPAAASEQTVTAEMAPSASI